MNFLAHCHLGRFNDEFIFGSLLGDFIKGRIDDNAFKPHIRAGIHMHRKLDVFTDANEHWKRSRDRLPAERRRFAGIIVDVIYDYCLSKAWSKFDDGSRADFIATCYGVFRAHCDQVEDNEARTVIRRIADEDWFTPYGEIDGIANTLRRISRRSPRLGVIADGIDDLREHADGFCEDFDKFYKDARRFAVGFYTSDTARGSW